MTSTELKQRANHAISCVKGIRAWNDDTHGCLSMELDTLLDEALAHRNHRLAERLDEAYNEQVG